MVYIPSRRILATMKDGPAYISEIVGKTGLSENEVIGNLIAMETRGLVKHELVATSPGVWKAIYSQTPLVKELVDELYKEWNAPPET